MPTPLDNSLQSRNLFLGFAGLVVLVAAWSIWGPSDIFPKAEAAIKKESSKSSSKSSSTKLEAPKGRPEDWTHEAMEEWLEAHNLMAGHNATKEELMAMVQSTLHAPK